MSIFDIPKSLLDAINLVLLKEHELTRGEVQAVSNRYNSEISSHKNAANAISGHIFPEGKDRLVLPLSTEEHPTKTAVESHLHRNGFHSTDYRAGLTKDSYNRSVSIGKALVRTNADKQLVNDFAKHQQTYADEPDTSHLQVVISKHPHDVVGMSQGTQWGLRPGEEHSTPDKHVQSCMRFGTYQHEKHIPEELNAGTHVAWLTNKGDDEAKEPHARITLRPYDRLVQSDHEEPKYTKFNLRFPKNSRYYREQYDDRGSHDEVEAAIPMNIHYMLEDESVPFGEEHHGTFHHSTDEHGMNFVSVFNKPLTKGEFSRFHMGLVRGLDANMSDIQATPDQSSAVMKASSDNTKYTKHTILVPGSKIYGQHSDAFKQTVDKWTKQHFEPKPKSSYVSRKGIYLDGDESKIET